MSADKYLSIFSRQMEAIVYIFAFTLRAVERCHVETRSRPKTFCFAHDVRTCAVQPGLKLQGLEFGTILRNSLPNTVSRSQNWPFPSCFETHYEARLSAKFSLRELVFIHIQTILIFTFALSLVFIMRFKATRKWPFRLCLLFNTSQNKV